MKTITSLWFLKLITFITLTLTIFGFFYFETSLILRILVVFLSLIGVWQIRNLSEILILLILYLGIFTLYNIRYGLAVPTAVILAIVGILTSFLFYAQSRLSILKPADKNLVNIFLLVTDLIVLEIFLVMSLWPVDPKTKTLVITVIFYLISKVVYLRFHNVLNLKRISGFLLASLVILATIFAVNWWMGF